MGSVTDDGSGGETILFREFGGSNEYPHALAVNLLHGPPGFQAFLLVIVARAFNSRNLPIFINLKRDQCGVLDERDSADRETAHYKYCWREHLHHWVVPLASPYLYR
jgi:hypothetical protein